MSSSSEWSSSDYSSSSESSDSDSGSDSGSEYSSDRSTRSASPDAAATAQPVQHGGASESEETAVSSPGLDTSTPNSGDSDIDDESASVIGSDGEGSESDAHAEEMWFEEAAWGDEASDQDDGGDAHDSSAWAADAWNPINSDGGEGVSDEENGADGSVAHDLPNGTSNSVPDGQANGHSNGHSAALPNEYDSNGSDSDSEPVPTMMVIDFPALDVPALPDLIHSALATIAEQGDGAPPPTYRNAMSEPPAYAFQAPAESIEDMEPLPVYEPLGGVQPLQSSDDASQLSTSARTAPELSSGPEPERATIPRTNSTHGPECTCNLCNILYPTPQVGTTPPLPPPGAVHNARLHETTPLVNTPQQYWGYAAVAAASHTENAERRRRRRRRRPQQQQEQGYRRGSIERVVRLARRILGDRTLDQDEAQGLLAWCAIDFFITAYPRYQLVFVLAFVGLGKLVSMLMSDVVAVWFFVWILWAYYYFQLEVSEWASQEEFARIGGTIIEQKPDVKSDKAKVMKAVEGLRENFPGTMDNISGANK